MAGLHLRTLAIAIESVASEMYNIDAYCKTLDQDSAECGDFTELLVAYELAARDLENAYRAQQAGVSNFPTYEDLISRNS